MNECVPGRGQEFGLDIGLDEEIAGAAIEERETRARKRYVELHLERRGGQHETAHARGIIVRPGGGQDRADTLSNYRDLFCRYLVRRANVSYEFIDILNERDETWTISARARRVTMSALIPGKQCIFAEAKLIHDVLKPAGMLVPAVQEHDRALRDAWRRARPMTIEQRDAVVRDE